MLDTVVSKISPFCPVIRAVLIYIRGFRWSLNLAAYHVGLAWNDQEDVWMNPTLNIYRPLWNSWRSFLRSGSWYWLTFNLYIKSVGEDLKLPCYTETRKHWNIMSYVILQLDTTSLNLLRLHGIEQHLETTISHFNLASCANRSHEATLLTSLKGLDSPAITIEIPLLAEERDDWYFSIRDLRLFRILVRIE